MIRKWFGALSGKKSEENLPPSDFRDLYLAYLKKSAPEVSWEIKDDLEITVALGDTGSHSVFLDNAYNQYLADPSSRDDILELYISSFLDVIAQKEAPIDPSRIVPVIKDRGWLEEIQAGLEERDDETKPLPEYLSDPYNSELAIFFAEDSPRNIRYLTVEAFDELDCKLDREKLLDFAVSNLKQLLPAIEITGGDGIYLITAGGDYEASLLLVDSIWDKEAMPVEGDYVVATPTRDLLIVTGTGHVGAIERLREMASEGAAQFSYRLTPVLFVRKNGRFEVFEG